MAIKPSAVILGHVLARHAGTTYEQLLIERIGTPLAMDDTGIALDERLRQRLAPPYDAGLRPAKNWDHPTLAGAGGIRSTCRDLLRFIQANSRSLASRSAWRSRLRRRTRWSTSPLPCSHRTQGPMRSRRSSSLRSRSRTAS